LAHRVPDRHAAFFWIGRPRQAMLGLWGVHTSPLALRLHFAFQVSLDNVVGCVAALRAAGLRPRSGAGDPIEEPEGDPLGAGGERLFRRSGWAFAGIHRDAARPTGTERAPHGPVGVATSLRVR
jgi:hypothetical protein